jgi:hypothetical protein
LKGGTIGGGNPPLNGGGFGGSGTPPAILDVMEGSGGSPLAPGSSGGGAIGGLVDQVSTRLTAGGGLSGGPPSAFGNEQGGHPNAGRWNFCALDMVA